MLQKIFKIILGTIIVFLVAAILAVKWLDSEHVKKDIVAAISAAVKSNLNCELEVEGLEITLPLSISAKKINLHDASGDLVSVSNFSTQIVPSPLFFLEVDLWKIAASKMEVNRIPLYKNIETTETSNSYIPRLVFRKIDLKEIKINKDLLGTEEDLAVRLRSNLNIASDLDVLLNIELLKPLNSLLQKGMIDIFLTYGLTSKNINLRHFAIDSSVIDLISNLRINFDSGEVSGNLKYVSSILGGTVPEALKGVDDLIDIDIAQSKDPRTRGEVVVSGEIGNVRAVSSGILPFSLIDSYNPWPDLKWETETHISNESTKGEIKITQGRLSGSGEYSLKDGIFNLQDFVLGHAFTKKVVNLKYDINSKQMSGFATFDSTDLQDINELLPFLQEGGFAKIRADYQLVNDKLRLQMHGKISDVDTNFGRIGDIQISVKSNDLTRASLSEAKITASRVFLDGLSIIATEINSFSNSSGEIVTNISTKLAAPYKGNIELEAKTELHEEITKITLQKLRGMLDGSLVKMPESIEVKLTKGLGFDLQAKNLSMGTGKMSIIGKMHDSKLDFIWDLNKIPATILGDFVTEDFDKAVIDGKLSLTGTSSLPIVSGNIKITNILFEKMNGASSFVANITANQKLLAIESDFVNNNTKTANLDINVPIDFSLAPVHFSLNDEQNFALHFYAKNPLNVVSAIKLPLGHKISGALSGKLDITGTLQEMKFNSNLLFSKGKYSYKGLGIKSKDISAKILSGDGGFVFKDIKINDYYGNFINATAKVNINDGFMFDLNLSTSKFNLNVGPYAQGEIRGKMRINGDITSSNASGDIEVGPVEIKIPERFSESIAEINVTKIINDEKDFYVRSPQEPYRLYLDIRAKTGDKVFVTGWGVNTKLEGKLDIKGSIDQPEIIGKLASKHGKYQDFGRQLDITVGQLIFDGPLPPSPYLNITGMTKEGNVELSVNLTGPISNPKITIASTPWLGEEETMSMLLFGQSSANISAFQALQLANSMRRLSTGQASTDPLQFSKKILKVDDIRLKQDKQNPENNSIGVGKYLTDKVYLEVEQGIETGATKTSIEAEISPKVSVEGSTENTGNSRVGVNWKHDY